SLFIICACLLAAVTLNSHAIEQSTPLDETKQTQQKNAAHQQDALDTLSQEANTPKKPVVEKVKADDSQVLGSESTKPV
ncbi:hypothetical protein R0J89_22200, partial [Psychrobacter sp. SIMBA_152]